MGATCEDLSQVSGLSESSAHLSKWGNGNFHWRRDWAWLGSHTEEVTSRSPFGWSFSGSI
jgi:uncharacterized membrane-anchored protein